jgi:ubiquinone/menaquinone biosynthesis C-methylase UbiE
MKNQFFEGADFTDSQFKALMPEYYPPEYKKYIEEEVVLLKEKLKGANRILEAGVGIGRLISELAPLVKQFIGVDNADLMIQESKKVASKFNNVQLLKANLENLSKLFPAKHFDFSVCVWNTLGNVENEVTILKELSKVTLNSIFTTTYLKGTLKQRENWYKTVGININKIDEENEIFYSKSGLRSRSYSQEDMQRIADIANLKVVDSKAINNVMLWSEFKA